MKLRWYDRILVALGGLVIAALGVCVVLAAGGVITLPREIAFDTWLGSGWQWMPLVFVVGALIIIWGLYLFIKALRRGSEGGKYYTLQSEADGSVRISVSAIDHLVHKCVDAYPEITHAKVRIGGREDAMEITLHVTVASNVRIPELVEGVRQEIKAHLKRSAGVTVEKVQIYVDATKEEQGKNAPEHGRASLPDERDDYMNVASFDKTPVVVTDDAPPSHIPVMANEPTVAELKKQVDLGPDEPLPVDLSSGAFPFPEKEAGVPLEIYTADVPISQVKEDGADG